MGEIRTHDPGFRTSEDSACLGSLCYRDQHITLYSPFKINQRFGGTYRLLLQCRRIIQARKQRKSRWQQVGCLLASRFDTENGDDFSFGTPVDFQRTTRRHEEPGGVGVRVPVGSRIISSPHRPDQLWGPPNLLAVSLGVMRPEHEADHLPPASAEVKKMWIYISTPPYAFMA
jgi:hypothetical protein